MQTKFEQALEVLTDYFLSDLPPIIEGTEFSEKFKKRMEKLIRRWEKPYYILINTVAKRVACIIICIIVALSALTISVRAFLPNVWNTIIEWFDEYISVVFQTQTDTPPETIEEIMMPKYVPEGLETIVAASDSSSHTSIFMRNNTTVFILIQNTYSIPSFIDDDSPFENILIRQYNGIININDDVHYLSWADEKYCYIISVYDPLLSDDELIAVAESIYD